MDIKILTITVYLLRLSCSEENTNLDIYPHNEIDSIIRELNLTKDSSDLSLLNDFYPECTRNPIQELDGKDLEMYFSILESLMDTSTDPGMEGNSGTSHQDSTNVLINSKTSLFDNFQRKINNLKKTLEKSHAVSNPKIKILKQPECFINLYKAIKKDIISHEHSSTDPKLEIIKFQTDISYDCIISSSFIVDMQNNSFIHISFEKYLRDFFYFLLEKVRSLILNQEIEKIDLRRYILQEKEIFISNYKHLPEINVIDLFLYKKKQFFVDYCILFIILRVMNTYVKKNAIDSEYDYKLFFLYNCITLRLNNTYDDRKMIVKRGNGINPFSVIKRIVIHVLDPLSECRLEKISDEDIFMYLSIHKTITFRIFLMMNLCLFNKWITILSLSKADSLTKLKYKQMATIFMNKTFELYEDNNNYYTTESMLECCSLIYEYLN